MKGAAVRSRLHTLRLERAAAHLGRSLLDDKREAILRALLDRTRRHAASRERAKAALAQAQHTLDEARIEAGAAAVDAAALAQPISASVDWRAGSVVGVATPRLEPHGPAFVPHFGAAAIPAAVDRAGAEFSALATALVRFAEDAEAVRNLQQGLTRTVHRLKALEEVVIPRLEREARDVTAALEEEERDETLRHRLSAATREESWPIEPNAGR